MNSGQIIWRRPQDDATPEKIRTLRIAIAQRVVRICDFLTSISGVEVKNPDLVIYLGRKQFDILLFGSGDKGFLTHATGKDGEAHYWYEGVTLVQVRLDDYINVAQAPEVFPS